MLAGIQKMCVECGATTTLRDMNCFKPAGGRLEVLGDSQFRVINDAYNASPESVQHALEICHLRVSLIENPFASEVDHVRKCSPRQTRVLHRSTRVRVAAIE